MPPSAQRARVAPTSSSPRSTTRSAATPSSSGLAASTCSSTGTTAPSYAELQTVPENRVYLSPDRADAFIRSFVQFSGGTIAGDNPKAPGVEIGRTDGTYRRVRLTSTFGTVVALVTDGHLPYPYGREMTG